MQLQAANHIDCTRQGGKAAGLGEQDSAERKQATGSGVLTGFRKGSRQQAAGAANLRVRASRGPSLPTWPPLLEVHLSVLELALADHPAAEASKACMTAAVSSPHLGGKMRRQAGGRQGGQAGRQAGWLASWLAGKPAATYLRLAASGVRSPDTRSPLNASTSSIDGLLACCCCCCSWGGGPHPAPPSWPQPPLLPAPADAAAEAAAACRMVLLPLAHLLPPQAPPLAAAGAGAAAPRVGKSCRRGRQIAMQKTKVGFLSQSTLTLFRS